MGASTAEVIPFPPFAGQPWRLTPLDGKRPIKTGWQHRENTIGADDYRGGNVGLVHEFSGTACLDIDDVVQATAWCKDRGVDLQSHLDAPDHVGISSGRANRAKLLFRLDAPMASRKIQGEDKRDVLDFRCIGMQDALPGSVHPDTGKPYEWHFGVVGDLQSIPELPASLHALWKLLLVEHTASESPKEPLGMSVEEVRELLFQRDPDVSRDDWVKDAFVLEHELGDAGYPLFVEWSKSGKKFKDERDCRSVWKSCGGSPNPRTIASWTYQASPPLTDAEFPMMVVPPERERLMPIQIGTWCEVAEQEWIVDGLIPDEQIGMIYGDSGSGKSFLAIDLAMSIALGQPWRGRDVTQRPIVYVASEGAGGVKRRIRGYAKAFGVDRTTVPVYGVDDSVSLMHEDFKILVERFKAIGPTGVAIIDTLAQALGGADENSSEGMGKAVTNATRLARLTGWLIILVHHSGKDLTKGARGWSGLRAACDFVLEVSGQTGIRTVRITKMKDGDGQGSESFRLDQVDLGVNKRGKVTTTCVLSREKVIQEAIRIRPTGGREKAILGALDQLGGGLHAVTKVLDLARTLLPPGKSEPAKVNGNLRNTADSLIDDQWLVLENGMWGLVQ